MALMREGNKITTGFFTFVFWDLVERFLKIYDKAKAPTPQGPFLTSAIKQESSGIKYKMLTFYDRNSYGLKRIMEIPMLIFVGPFN